MARPVTKTLKDCIASQDSHVFLRSKALASLSIHEVADLCVGALGSARHTYKPSESERILLLTPHAQLVAALRARPTAKDDLARSIILTTKEAFVLMRKEPTLTPAQEAQCTAAREASSAAGGGGGAQEVQDLPPLPPHSLLLKYQEDPLQGSVTVPLILVVDYTCKIASLQGRDRGGEADHTGQLLPALFGLSQDYPMHLASAVDFRRTGVTEGKTVAVFVAAQDDGEADQGTYLRSYMPLTGDGKPEQFKVVDLDA